MISLSNGGSSSSAVSSGYSGYFRNRIEVYDQFPGTKQLTIPNGWNKIRVAVVGGGGGGAVTQYDGYNNGGGGGGYSEITLNVVPGQVYSYTVGAGGKNYTAGGTSSFGGLISATGGGYGINNTQTAATGGVGIGGTVNTAGGKGGVGPSNGWGGGGGASGNRYDNGGDGGAPANGGGPGGSWPNYPRPLLYDDGFGLGITPYTPPIGFVGAVMSSAVNNTNDADSSRASYPIMSVGMGQLHTSYRPNIGGGGCGIGYGSGTTPIFASAGIGGGGGGSISGFNIGGNGLVIVEVLG